MRVYLNSDGASRFCVSLLFLHTFLRDPLLSSTLRNSREIFWQIVSFQLHTRKFPMPFSCGVLNSNFVPFHCKVSLNENTFNLREQLWLS